MIFALNKRARRGWRAGHAVAVFKAARAGFDLVITDYAMFRLTGLDLAAAIRKIRADVPIIPSTGYSENFSPRFVRMRKDKNSC